MRPLTTLVAALSVLVHLLLGCCSHHAHTALAAYGGERYVCGHEDADVGDAHRPGGPDCGQRGPQHSDPPAKKCDGSRCVFALGGKVNWDKARLADSPWCDAVVRRALLPHTVLRQPADLGQHHVGSSLRPHLIHQVLLI